MICEVQLDGMDLAHLAQIERDPRVRIAFRGCPPGTAVLVGDKGRVMPALEARCARHNALSL